MSAQDGVRKHLADAIAQMNQFQEINEHTFRNFVIFSQLRIIELLEKDVLAKTIFPDPPQETQKDTRRKK